MKYIFWFFVQFFLLGGALAQPLMFQKAIGGIFSDEGAQKIGHTLDGNFIISGFTGGYGAGNFDFYVLKIDSNANILWQKAYGGHSSETNTDLKQTSDSGFIVLGASHSFGTGSSDILLIKLDRHGNDVWSKTFGGMMGDYGNLRSGN